jgi:NDP-hexose-3-ketoreductase
MIKRNINIACWSVGQHAVRNMLPAIAQCNDVSLAGIYTRNKSRSKEQSQLYGCRAYSQSIDLLKDHNVDAVYLSSPTGVHAAQIKECLNAGKSVLVEKTALSSLKETQVLTAMAKREGLVIMEAFMYRFHNQFKTLKELIESKKYGNVIKIDCEFGFPHLSPNDIRYKANLCGGATYDAGAYTLSAARYLLGEKAKLVWAKTIKLDEYEVDTGGHAILESTSCIANCTWAFGASYSNKIRIWCEEGHILCDRAFSKAPNYSSSIVIKQNGEVVENKDTGCDNHFVKLLSYFSNILLVGDYEQEYIELLEQSEIVESSLILGKSKF